MALLCLTATLLMCVMGAQTLDLLRAAAVTSGAPSAPPSAPKVNCWCSSYPNVTVCSWPEPSHSPPSHYVATYRERHGQPITRKCNIIPPGQNSSSSISSSSSSPSSDQLWHCELPNLKLLTNYIINVTAVNAAGSSSYLSSFMLEDIVKPDPPSDVQVSPQSSRKLQVQWSPPATWTNLHIFPLKYHIMYHRDNMSVTLGPFESTMVELKGLSSGRSYQFQVCAKELLDLGKCSHWSSPVNITLPRTKL